MNARLRRWPALFLGLALFTFGRPAWGTVGPKLVILAVDRVTLDDLSEVRLPNLERLMRQGAVGLMTTRVYGGLAPEKIYLSVGAGEPATGGPETAEVYDAGEITRGMAAHEEYRFQTGLTVRSQVIHLGLAGVARNNKGLAGQPGRLGQALADADLVTAVWGNADRPGDISREAATVLMDAQGCVPLGRVGVSSLTADVLAPGGMRTDYALLASDYAHLSRQADVILVTLGDIARLRSLSGSLTPVMSTSYLRSTLRRIDGFVGLLFKGSERPARILWLAASPPLPQVTAGERLTPFILWGDGVTPGLATSNSTRQPGIVTPYDLTATIASSLGVEYGAFTMGRPIRGAPGDPEELPDYYHNLVHNYRQRFVTFFLYGCLMLTAAVVSCLWTRSGRKRRADLSRGFLVGLAMVPDVLLIMGLFPMGPLWLTLLIMVLTAILAGALLSLLEPPLRLTVIGLLTAALVLVDVLRGSPLLRQSLLGYSPLSGVRFYGLGNEYLGVVLGAVILGATGFKALRPNGGGWFLGILFTLTTLVIALPRFGANVGGGIAALTGLGYTYLALMGRRIGWREWLGLGLGVIVLLASLTFLDLLTAHGQASHLGWTVLRIRAEGPQIAWSIIQSKISMTFGILTYTTWTWFLLGLLAGISLLLRFPPVVFRPYLPREHLYLVGLRGMLVAAAVGLLFNDPGLVVAATVVIYLGLLIVHLPGWPALRAEGVIEP